MANALLKRSAPFDVFWDIMRAKCNLSRDEQYWLSIGPDYNPAKLFSVICKTYKFTFPVTRLRKKGLRRKQQHYDSDDDAKFGFGDNTVVTTATESTHGLNWLTDVEKTILLEYPFNQASYFLPKLFI